jgi:hypothetical protein
MKRITFALALSALAASAFATDVGVSVSVSQPGLYGRIDIGNVPQPPVLVYPQPVIIAPQRVAVQQQPIYLHVPPGHAKDWGKHCGKYNACNQRVYFVQEQWYQQQYVPAIQAKQAKAHKEKGGHGKGGHDKGGHGHDKGEKGGKGNGKGKD